jgi:hypothetical protein
MNAVLPPRPEKSVKHVAGGDTASQAASTGRACCFTMQAAPKCLGPGRYLILMRQSHGRGNWKRFASSTAPAGS